MTPPSQPTSKFVTVNGLRLHGDACAATGCKPQSKTVPERFHVPAFERGIRTFEVTNCGLKEGSRRPSVPTVCFHGTRSGNALIHPQERKGRSGEHRTYEGLRSATGANGA